jgi:hypothetical protein
MISSGAQDLYLSERHISSKKATSERLSQKFGCGRDSHLYVKDEFVSGYGIMSAYQEMLVTRQSIPLETNADKTYKPVSCTQRIDTERKAVNSLSINRIGIDNNTLQEQQEETLVDHNPMEGSIYLIEKIKEKKKRRKR